SSISFFLILPRPPISTLFPYTTLFRSPINVDSRIVKFLDKIGLSSLYQTYIKQGLLFYRGDRHLMTIAPTRSGKGTGYIITNALDRKSTRLNSSHVSISYAVFCLKKKN